MVLLSAVPGARGAAASTVAAITSVAVWVAVLGTWITATDASFAESMTWPYPVCLLKVISIAMLPGMVLIAMVRRAGPFRVHWTSGLAGLAAGAIGALGAQLACPNANPAHALLGHVAPMLALTIAAVAFGRLIMRPRNLHLVNP